MGSRVSRVYRYQSINMDTVEQIVPQLLSFSFHLELPQKQRLPSYAGHHSTQLGTAFIHRGFVPPVGGHEDAAKATRRAAVSVPQRCSGGLSNEDTACDR